MRSEYLAELRESHRHLLKKARGDPQVAVGDVVIIHDEDLPRSFWRLGRIRTLIVGRDGQTRGATVGVVGKNRRFSSLNRPLQRLYPLETNRTTAVADSPPRTEGVQTTTETQPGDQPRPERSQHSAGQPRPERSQRASAKKGEERRRQWIRELTEET